MEKENKHDKFVRLAESRTNKIIDMIQLLGNCSNKSVYEYTDNEVKQIFQAIQKELDQANRRFQANPTRGEDSGFRIV